MFLRRLLPPFADGYISYHGVPIVFQDDVDSSIWRAVALSSDPGVKRVAKHVDEHSERRPAYKIVRV